MPTISANTMDLKKLVGKPLSDEELCNQLQMMGVEVEENTGDELKLEISHNRSDLLGVEGVARSLRGFLNVETGLRKYKMQNPKHRVDVDPSTKRVRPYIVAGVVEKVKLDDEATVASLMDLQEKIHLTLGRNRSEISIGVYDLDTVKPPFKYTTVAPESIKFIPLDSVNEMTPAQILTNHPKVIEYAHLLKNLKRYPLLTDSKGEVLSMPPIINSESTRVTEYASRLFIDVTGFNEKLAEQALRVIMTGLAERGFKIQPVKIKHSNRTLTTPNLKPEKMSIDVARANQTIGLDLKPREIAKIMKRMRYGVKKSGKKVIELEVPSYREDVMHEVDLIEDLAIGYGYDRMEPTLPPVMTTGSIHPVEAISNNARRVMTGLGFTEFMNYTLTNQQVNFDLMRDSGKAAKIANPVSEDYTMLRTKLLPGVLNALCVNRRHELPQQVFEVGDVVLLDASAETGTKEVRRVAGAVISSEASLTQIKAVAEALLRELGVEWEIKTVDHPSFISGRVGEIVSGGKRIGLFGEIHPEVIVGFKLEHPVAAFELDLPR